MQQNKRWHCLQLYDVLYKAVHYSYIQNKMENILPPFHIYLLNPIIFSLDLPT